MKLNNIRKQFLSFFAKNNHNVIPSASLVPHSDPTLMFTNAGMVPFKEYFIGNKMPKFKCATSAQKCVRAGGKHNDLDNVGYTNRHHTFFEMLGNFSFSKYGKEEAIYLAWKFITEELGLSAERLYVTVYHTDDEAADLWEKVANLPTEKILRIESSDNFWSMGDTGPCGPCSEIFYDHMGGKPKGLPGSTNEDSDRFVEIWNLVFMQYNRTADGSQTLLPHIGIDTGMGLERITAVMQGVLDNYDIDLFQELIASSHALSKNYDNKAAHKIITDHLRSSAFLIADGVMPSNQGRGYVLRRIIRRAVRYIYQINHHQPLLCELFPTLLEIMGKDYPELSRAKDNITHTLRIEEESFFNTLDSGLMIMQKMVEQSSNKLSGNNAFKLYDTYGFPLDITIDLLKEKNMEVDVDGFQQEMQKQKERAKSAWVGSGAKGVDKVWYEILEQVQKTEFIEKNHVTCEIAAVVQENQIIDKKHYNDLKVGDKIAVVLYQTPFYAESGGQLGDTGILVVEGVGTLEVLDTKKVLNSLYIHFCQIQSGSLSSDHNMVIASFNEQRRKQLRAAHSATHLLHFALRQRLGGHITQKGSLVAEERLRFDFNHNQALTTEELRDVERNVNSLIWQNASVIISNMPKEQAMNTGAMALFGEKYDDIVRVVKIGDSIELCGGSHVAMTGEIAMCKIIKESSIGSGIRRIEALVREKAYQYYCDQENDYISTISSCNKQIKDSSKVYKKQIGNLHKRIIDNVIPTIEERNGIKVIIKVINDIPIQAGREVIMGYTKDEKCLALLCFVNDQQASCILALNKDLNFNATELLKSIDENARGNKDFAQLNTETQLLDNIITNLLNKVT